QAVGLLELLLDRLRLDLDVDAPLDRRNFLDRNLGHRMPRGGISGVGWAAGRDKAGRGAAPLRRAGGLSRFNSTVKRASVLSAGLRDGAQPACSRRVP